MLPGTQALGSTPGASFVSASTRPYGGGCSSVAKPATSPSLAASRGVAVRCRYASSSRGEDLAQSFQPGSTHTAHTAPCTDGHPNRPGRAVFFQSRFRSAYGTDSSRRSRFDSGTTTATRPCRSSRSPYGWRPDVQPRSLQRAGAGSARSHLRRARANSAPFRVVHSGCRPAGVGRRSDSEAMDQTVGWAATTGPGT
jgi:hypothetical protein